MNDEGIHRIEDEGLPTREQEDAIVESIRKIMRVEAAKARKRGFVFSPTVGYMPWGPSGPAVEVRPWN